MAKAKKLMKGRAKNVRGTGGRLSKAKESKVHYQRNKAIKKAWIAENKKAVAAAQGMKDLDNISPDLMAKILDKAVPGGK